MSNKGSIKSIHMGLSVSAMLYLQSKVRKHLSVRLIIMSIMTQDQYFLTTVKSPTYASKTCISHPFQGFVLRLSQR